MQYIQKRLPLKEPLSIDLCAAARSFFHVLKQETSYICKDSKEGS